MASFSKTTKDYNPHEHVMATITQDEIRRLQILMDMLTYKRPAGSRTEQEFIKKHLEHLPGMTQDHMGNCIVRIGGAPTVLWSSHTDTVHREQGRQRVVYREKSMRIALSRDEREAPKGANPKDSYPKSNCLGADCTTGVWLMHEMILAGVPGLYVFHAAEECGGHGSDFIARKTPELLDGICHAIAFDRMGRHDIITSQMGGICASDTFAESLAPHLPGKYMASPFGSFTDTANYMDIVPECSNIAVGYFDQHSHNETQCVPTAIALRRALIRLTPEVIGSLAVARDPREERYDYDPYYDPYYGANDLWERGDPVRKFSGKEEMYDIVYENPQDVAELLEQLGYTVRDVKDWLGL